MGSARNALSQSRKQGWFSELMKSWLFGDMLFSQDSEVTNTWWSYNALPTEYKEIKSAHPQTSSSKSAVKYNLHIDPKTSNSKT